MKILKDRADELRSWADHPAASGYVPIHPNTLRELAALIDPRATAQTEGGRLIAISVTPVEPNDAWLSVRFNRPFTVEEMNQLHFHINHFKVPAPVRPRRIDSDDYYRVVLDPSHDAGCKECLAGRFWTIAAGTGKEESLVGISWADEELTEQICELMNMARSDALPVAV